MSQVVPNLSLSLGQVLWCLAGGKDPEWPLPEQIRYLRQLDIPLDPEEEGAGKGGRQRYDFYHLIELGIAREGLRRQVPPRNLQNLSTYRPKLRALYREAYKDLAKEPSQFEEPAGQMITWYDDEFFVRLHDRSSDTPGAIEPILPDHSNAVARFGDWVETYKDEPEGKVIVPVKQTMVELLRLARIAPATKPGPKR